MRRKPVLFPVIFLAVTVGALVSCAHRVETPLPTASYGLLPKSEPEPWTRQEQEFHDGFSFDSKVEWAAVPGGRAEWIRRLRELASLRQSPCGLACLELAVQVQRAGRAQINGVVENETAQRQSAKGQLEGLFRTTHAEGIPEWVKQEVRIYLRDAFLPPSIHVVKAALAERRHRSGEERVTPLPPGFRERKVDAYLDWFLSISRSLASHHHKPGPVPLTSTQVEVLFSNFEYHLDRVEQRLDYERSRNPDALAFWVRSPEIRNRIIQFSATVPTVNWDAVDYLAARVYTRTETDWGLDELIAYAPLYGL